MAAAATTDAFASAMEKAAEMTRYLESREAFTATHTELEEFVAEEGRELLRRMLQAHYALRVAADARSPPSPMVACRSNYPKNPRAVPPRVVEWRASTV
jgi:hypothetical protein